MYFCSHSLSTFATRLRLRPGSSASPKCLSTRFLRASIPRRSSLESWEATSLRKSERECEDREARELGGVPEGRELSSVSVDSRNS